MNHHLPRVAFWLVPDRNERSRLQVFINELAKRYSAPLFVPHVTIYSCRRSEQQLELSAMSRLVRNCPPTTMAIEGLIGMDKLTQALCLGLKPVESVAGLSRKLHAAVPIPSKYKLQPHLSLLYQDLTFTEREDLIAETRVDAMEICFAEMWAVAIPEKLVSMDDLIGWQTLLTCRLAPDRNIDNI